MTSQDIEELVNGLLRGAKGSGLTPPFVIQVPSSADDELVKRLEENELIEEIRKGPEGQVTLVS